MGEMEGGWAEFQDISVDPFPVHEGFPVDDWGGDHESLVFATNFYDETDDVTRNVNFDRVAFGTQSAFDGDFCDVLCQDWHSSLQKSLDFSSLEPDLDTACTGDLCTEVDSETLLPPTSVRFLAGDIPPSVPSTPFFKLLPTTLHIPSMSALDVANALFTICTSRGWSVVKVNRAKFTIKVQVWENGLSCLMKVRVYERDGCDVEFSRQSGDGLAFAAAFAVARALAESRIVAFCSGGAARV